MLILGALLALAGAPSADVVNAVFRVLFWVGLPAGAICVVGYLLVHASAARTVSMLFWRAVSWVYNKATRRYTSAQVSKKLNEYLAGSVLDRLPEAAKRWRGLRWATRSDPPLLVQAGVARPDTPPRGVRRLRPNKPSAHGA